MLVAKNRQKSCIAMTKSRVAPSLKYKADSLWIMTPDQSEQLRIYTTTFGLGARFSVQSKQSFFCFSMSYLYIKSTIKIHLIKLPYGAVTQRQLRSICTFTGVKELRHD